MTYNYYGPVTTTCFAKIIVTEIVATPRKGFSKSFEIVDYVKVVIVEGSIAKPEINHIQDFS